jgi:hypothetical protein
MEWAVFDEPTLAEAVGLKHVIEDGLAILKGRHMDERRRDFVMRDLRTLLNQAIRGSHIASQSTLFLGEDDRQAFGSFALIDRYLGAGRAPGWLHHAPDALRVIEQLQQAEMPEEKEKQAALEILSTLLTQISTEPTLELGAGDSHNSRTE